MTMITFIKQGKVIDRKFVDELTIQIRMKMMDYAGEIAADTIEYEQL